MTDARYAEIRAALKAAAHTDATQVWPSTPDLFEALFDASANPNHTEIWEALSPEERTEYVARLDAELPDESGQ